MSELKSYLASCVEAGTIGQLAAQRIEADFDQLTADLKSETKWANEYCAQAEKISQEYDKLRTALENLLSAVHIRNDDPHIKQFGEARKAIEGNVGKISNDIE